MSIEKTTAVVLSLTPYRESSCIVRLYTSTHGLIHGIAKGIRRNAKGSTPLERGFLIELLVYCKPNRDLHTLADLQVIDFYPSIRGNLQKSALRDTSFELLLHAIKPGDTHVELFELLVNFLNSLEERNSKEQCFTVLWSFFFGISELHGFAFHFERCQKCGSEILDDGGLLSIEKGGILCKRCSVSLGHRENYIDSYTLKAICDKGTLPDSVPYRELIRISRIAISYCRYHFEIHQDFKTLEFLAQMHS